MGISSTALWGRPWQAHFQMSMYTRIFKNTHFLLEMRLSMPTTVWPQAFLRKTLKILDSKVLEAITAFLCIFL